MDVKAYFKVGEQVFEQAQRPDHWEEFVAEIGETIFRVYPNGVFKMGDNTFFVVYNHTIEPIGIPELRRYVETGVGLDGSSFNREIEHIIGDNKLGFYIDWKTQKLVFFANNLQGAKIFCANKFVEIETENFGVIL